MIVMFCIYSTLEFPPQSVELTNYRMLYCSPDQNNQHLSLSKHPNLSVQFMSLIISLFSVVIEVRGPISILYIRVNPFLDLKVICVKCKCLFPLAVAQITSPQTPCHLPRTNSPLFLETHLSQNVSLLRH